MSENFDCLLKIVLIGDSGVGKSSLLLRFTNDIFDDDYISTIGVDFKLKTVKINDRLIKIQVWDTAGTEKFSSITSCFYRGSDGIIFVYSVTDEKTYQNIPFWINEVDRSTGIRNKRILIGNKSDLLNERTVSVLEAKEFAESKNLQYIETSAKTSENVEEAFLTLVDDVIASYQNVILKDDTNIELNKHRSYRTDQSCNYC